MDDEALEQARHASYPAEAVQDVPEPLLERYFERLFGRHDLVQDAPISRVNLLTCRNTLMYFNRETQAKVLSRFHFALRQGGFLFMGKAESPPSGSRPSSRRPMTTRRSPRR